MRVTLPVRHESNDYTNIRDVSLMGSNSEGHLCGSAGEP